MSAGEGSTSQRAIKQQHEARDAEQQEKWKMRRLQAMMQLLLATIAQDQSLTVEEAAVLVARTRESALRMFPDKEVAFNLLCRPRIQRAMRERFRTQ